MAIPVVIEGRRKVVVCPTPAKFYTLANVPWLRVKRETGTAAGQPGSGRKRSGMLFLGTN